jgi:hypothetical protein
MGAKTLPNPLNGCLTAACAIFAKWIFFLTNKISMENRTMFKSYACEIEIIAQEH